MQPGIRPPPSLVNIYKEMQSDLGITPARHGFLEHWAKQGVLLLNSVLTVRMGQAASHRERGWERFTDARSPQVNGSGAGRVHALGQLRAEEGGVHRRIDKGGHLVLKAPHPCRSPRMAASSAAAISRRPMLSSRAHGLPPVDWALAGVEGLTGRGRSRW